MMSEPLTGWRHVDVIKRRRKQEFAEQMRSLVDEHYPDALYEGRHNTHRESRLVATGKYTHAG
jgi:hypothetical protein